MKTEAENNTLPKSPVGNETRPVQGDMNRKPSAPEMDRRTLLGHLLSIGATSLAAAMGGAATATLATASAEAAEPPRENPTDGAAKRKFRYGMVIDTRRCVGCKACVVACKAENKTPPGVAYTVVLEGALQPRIEDKPLFMTKPCFHCENPACTVVCPVGATFKRPQDGIVVVDYDRCIGCRYCMTACPYGARFFDYGDNYPAVSDQTPYAHVPSPEYQQFRPRQKGKSPIGNVRKCTFCLHLQDAEGRYDKTAGRWPACATTCTGHAIHFGDFMDPESEVSRLLRERPAIRLKEELGNEPNVYYLL
jgi:molybdopterin-containing oxidoreductase family iron-sulfur binding subunit